MSKTATFTVGKGRYGIDGPEITLHFTDDATDHDVACARCVIEGDEYDLMPIRHGGQQPSVIVDVGANVGAFSLMAATLFPRARIYAYEPNPLIFSMLQRNIQRVGGNITAYEYALSDKRGDAVLRVGDVSVCGELSKVRGFSNYAEGSIVTEHPVRTMDVVTELSFFEQVDVLKLDCEGSEREIVERIWTGGNPWGIRWIRGEWHGQESKEKCQSLISRTHVCNFNPNLPHAVGSFIGHNKLG